MKRLLGVAIGGVVLLVIVTALAVVGYRQGWFSRSGVKPPAGSAGGGVVGSAGAGEQAPPSAGGGAGGPSAGQPAPPASGGPATGQAGQPAVQQFDGNVAALAWGGKVESVTGIAPDNASDVDWTSDLIDGNPDTYWHTQGEVHGPTEIVLSFADHDSVRIGQVKIFSHTEWAPRDVEVWVSNSGPAAGFTRVATATLPGDFNVGLRIYGHREISRSPKTCTDSELVVPVQKLDQQAILNAAEAVKPRGETPLVYSVLQSITDLKDVGGGTVIVITDGEESCHGDPVKAAAQLKASGLDITLNIVGFTLTGQAVRKALGGFAQATGGRFYEAASGDVLARALLMAAVDRLPYSVLDATGKEVASGEAGAGADELPPGEYTVVVTAGGTTLKAEHVRVALAQQTTLRIAARNDQFVLEQ